MLGERQLHRLPRSQSSSNILVANNEFINLSRYDSHMIHVRPPLGEAGVDDLRELAKVFRMTGPSLRIHTSSESRLGVSKLNDARRWSTKSLRKDRRVKTHVQSISRLPRNTIAGKTTDGYSHVTISIPYQYKHLSRSRSQPSPVMLLEPEASLQERLETTSWRRFTTGIPLRSSSRTIHSDSVCSRKQSSERKSPSHRDLLLSTETGS
ncbi:hypothetical protein GGR53DRAFT_128754 [Hypoxylon sp. FL1150]|nr:hypothetical protein GGR53DRAFT_128754 [Hypoxylon sp. FL1150]